MDKIIQIVIPRLNNHTTCSGDPEKKLNALDKPGYNKLKNRKNSILLYVKFNTVITRLVRVVQTMKLKD